MQDLLNKVIALHGDIKHAALALEVSERTLKNWSKGLLPKPWQRKAISCYLQCHLNNVEKFSVCK